MSILILIAEKMPFATGATWSILRAADRAILGLFALELLLRLATVEPPGRRLFIRTPHSQLYQEIKARLVYLMRPLTLIDLFTVLTLLPGLRALRAVRLLRLIRSVRLFRYADPVRTGMAAIRDNSLVYTAAFALLLVSVFFGGLTMYFAEAGAEGSQVHDAGDALWWAMVTITTVGYGDVTPATPAGRIIASLLMVAGMFCIATFAGVVSHTLAANVFEIRKEQLRMSTRTGHIVICGYDSIILPLLESLAEEFPASEQSMVIFATGDPPQNLPESFTWIPGDPTKESELDKVRMAHARTVIVTGRRDGRTSSAVDAVAMLTIFTIRSYMEKQDARGLKRRVPLQVVAEVLDPENESFALQSGADEVVLTARMGLSILAHTVAMPGTGTALGLMAAKHTQNIYVGSIPADLDPAPRTFADLVRSLKEDHDVLAIGVKPPGAERIVLNPAATHAVEPGSAVIYLSSEPTLGADPLAV